MAGGSQTNSLTNVEALFDALFARDPSGRQWLPGLLRASPRGRAALGELVDEPGSLEIALAVYGINGRLATFEYQVPPPRELLAWFIDHPQELEWPADAELSPETATLRRALLNDDPPGSRARAQDRAHERLATAAPLLPDWWRFEEVTRPTAVLATDRLVLLIEAAGTDELSQAADWYPPRSRLIRVLEAAKQLSHGRRWGTVLISDEALPDGEALEQALEGGALEQALERGAPHLTATERSELAASYLGRLTWREAHEAVELPEQPSPRRT